jgi:hypothetical protein
MATGVQRTLVQRSEPPGLRHEVKDVETADLHAGEGLNAEHLPARHAEGKAIAPSGIPVSAYSYRAMFSAE